MTGTDQEHVQRVKQVLAARNEYIMQADEWRLWQVRVLRFPHWFARRESLREVCKVWRVWTASRARLHQRAFWDEKLRHCLAYKKRLHKVLIAWREFSSITAPRLDNKVRRRRLRARSAFTARFAQFFRPTARAVINPPRPRAVM